MGWERDIIRLKENVKKNLGYCSLNKKQTFELRT
jgi:hypothetical protein